ncbi:MAG: molybdenum cofactor guanylyltransferase [Candidatus Bathyarchaeia archaeon]
MPSTSTIILAGGLSTRFGFDKVFAKLKGKALLLHVVDAVKDVTDETLVVVGNLEQKSRLLEIRNSLNVVVDNIDIRSPLTGAISGFEKAKGEFSILLPSDTPLLSRDILLLLLRLSYGYEATIPRWPNWNIEPLQAVYETAKMLAAMNEAFRSGELRIYDAIKRLRKVLYISTDILRAYDHELNTFENVNTVSDLKRVESIASRKRHQKPVSTHTPNFPLKETLHPFFKIGNSSYQ